MKKIVLNSSDLAKITGHNKFDTLESYVDKVLSKHNIIQKYIPKTNTEQALRNCNKEKLTLIKKELKLKDTATMKDIEQRVNIITSSSLTNKTEEGSKNDLTKSLLKKPIIKDILKGSIEKDIRMSRGNIKENSALDKSQVTLNVPINKRNSDFYTAELLNTKKCAVFLCGKVDGITDDGKVVETKNRRNRLFNKIPDYEKVQMEAYMYLTNIPTCIHIENYNNTTNTAEYHHIKVFWGVCLDSITKFVEQYIDTQL